MRDADSDDCVARLLCVEGKVELGGRRTAFVDEISSELKSPGAQPEADRPNLLARDLFLEASA